MKETNYKEKENEMVKMKKCRKNHKKNINYCILLLLLIYYNNLDHYTIKKNTIKVNLYIWRKEIKICETSSQQKSIHERDKKET